MRIAFNPFSPRSSIFIYFGFSRRSVDSVSQPIFILIMQRQNKSALLLAGEQSLAQSSHLGLPQCHPKKAFDVKAIIKRLRIERLRKMQGLVRGFLCRRLIYPRALVEHEVSRSLGELIVWKVIRRECKEVAHEETVFAHAEGQSEENYYAQGIYQSLLKRIIEKDFSRLVQDAILERGHLISRPKITYGLNLRDGMELLLYDKIAKCIEVQCREIAQESIREAAREKRELRVVDSWIDKYGMLSKICQQAMQECLLECVDQYVCDSVIDRVCREGVMVVAQLCYQQELRSIEELRLGEMEMQVEQWLVQEGLVRCMVQNGYGVQK